MSIEDWASIVGVAIFAILTVFLFVVLTYWLYRRWRERSLTLVVPSAFQDIWGEKFTVNRDARPYLYWSLFSFYAAILLGIVVSMVVPLLSGIPLLLGMTK